MATFKSMVKEHIRFLLNMQARGFTYIFWGAYRMEVISSNKSHISKIATIKLSKNTSQTVL